MDEQGGGHHDAVSSPLSGGLAPRADQLRFPLLLQGERSLEHRVDCELRLATAALGLTGSSAMNSAQENSDCSGQLKVPIAGASSSIFLLPHSTDFPPL